MRSQFLVAGLAMGTLLGTPATAAAADPASIGIAPLDNLLRGADPNGYLQPGGSYAAVFFVEGSVIGVDLTFELPPSATSAEPGPIVVYWQFVNAASDVEFADTYDQAVDPPQTATVTPRCNASGSCDLSLRITGSADLALEAADLEWVLSLWVHLRVTVARTYEEGSLVQLFAPGYVDGTAGTLANPTSVEGTLLSTGVNNPETLNSVDVAGAEFGLGGPPYEWATELESALGPGRPSASLAAVPTQSSATSPRAAAENPAVVALIAIAALVAVAVALFALSYRNS